MKITNAQAALLHAAESLGISVLITLVAACYQYFIVHGFNVQGLIGVGAISFLGAFSMLYKSLLANPNFSTALNDTVKELSSVVENHTAAISSLQASMQATQAPAQLVQVNPVTPVPSNAVTNPPQLQFVPMNRSFTNLEMPAVVTSTSPTS